MANDQLKEIFLTEAEELLSDLEDGLVAMEENPDDDETLHRIFRAAHTIKGSAGLTGFERIVEFTHVMENVLDRLREHTLSVSPKLISTLLQSVDVIKEMTERAAADDPMDSVDGYDDSLVSLRSFISEEKATEPDALSLPETRRNDATTSVFEIRMKFREDLFDTGQDPHMLLDELADLGKIVLLEPDASNLPELESMDPYKLYLSWRVALETTEPRSNIENVFIFVADENEIQIEDMTAEYMERLQKPDSQKRIGELLVEEGLVTEMEVATALKQQKKTGEILVEQGLVSEEHIENALKKQESSRDGRRNTVIRVDTEKLDKLVNLVGELVTGVAQVKQLAGREDSDADHRLSAVESLEQISRDLQEQVMVVRMVPIEATFNRFKRVVRDMANELGKKVNLIMEGIETELDKNVIEQLADPLKHLIRNCVDHGLETPEERLAAGKRETGNVWLRAMQQEGNIIIQVSDDGRGINREKVLAKAIEKGLVDERATLSDRQIFELLFHPGFSTADKVTDLSGRGVGMDVVRRNIEDMRGNVEVTSKPNQGTMFRIKLPLTLAIIDGMNVQVGSETLTIPLLSIIEQIRPKPGEVKTVEGEGELVDVRGKYLPMVRLHRLFNYHTEKTNPTDALVMVLENEGRQFCVLVDEVLGQQQAVIKALDKNFRKIDGVAGATILGDGTISLILDVHGMERMAFTH